MFAVGHHGTSIANAKRILADGFASSTNRYDWLGHGTYFFQEAPNRALSWAKEKFAEGGCVVEATICLDGYIDLLDINWSKFLAEVHDRYIEVRRGGGDSPPVQRGGVHGLDCAILNFAVDLLYEDGLKIKGVRGAFQEGHAIFPNSALFSLSHVQIAVLDHSSIEQIKILSDREIREWNEKLVQRMPWHLLNPLHGSG